MMFNTYVVAKLATPQSIVTVRINLNMFIEIDSMHKVEEFHDIPPLSTFA